MVTYRTVGLYEEEIYNSRLHYTLQRVNAGHCLATYFYTGVAPASFWLPSVTSFSCDEINITVRTGNQYTQIRDAV